MLLHLCDDEKFIDSIIERFELINPNKNIYFIETSNEENKLLFVKSTNKNIIVGNSSSISLKKLTDNIDSYDAVILHNFYNEYKKDIVLNTSTTVHFHWMCWGADLYGLPWFSKRLLLRETKKHVLKSLTSKERISLYLYKNHFKIYSYLYKKVNNKPHPSINDIDLMRKMNSVSTVIPTEYSFIEKHISKDIKYLPYTISTLESLLSNDLESICSDNNFLVGNSANIYNNHLDILKQFSKISFENNKLFFPLSYGDNINAKFISDSAKSLFNSNVVILDSFLSKEEYNELINICGNIVMNHTRQQGMGNIKMGLWKGARVFLNKKNPIYKYLVAEGFIIFSTNDIHKYRSLPSFEELSKHNRPLLKKIYSTDKVINETKELIQFFKSKKNFA